MKNRVLIWNAHWETCGGGERYALELGKQIFILGYEVSFAGPERKGLEKAMDTLGILNFEYDFIVIKHENELLSIAQDYHAFINGSFGSALVAPIPRSIYICHFPTYSRRARLGSKLFKNRHALTQVCNASGVILNPPFNRVIWSNQSTIITLPESKNISIKVLEGEVLISHFGNSSILKSSEFFTFDAPTTIWCEVPKESTSSYIVSNVDMHSWYRVFLSRFLPATGAHHSYKQVWANSMFTEKWISRWWGIDSIVVYPPVETKTQKSTSLLENKILSVGRFMSTKHHHSKNQLQLVRALKRINRIQEKYSLTLIGGLSKSEEKYFRKVVKDSANHPVEILPNATSSQLADSITNATFYWHAAGLGQPSRKPQNFEHFGIAPIEAMAAGLIPLVYEKGGPAEVLRDFPELIYSNIRELVSKTKSLDPGQISDLSQKMISLSHNYDTKVFAKRIEELLRLLD